MNPRAVKIAARTDAKTAERIVAKTAAKIVVRTVGRIARIVSTIAAVPATATMIDRTAKDAPGTDSEATSKIIHHEGFPISPGRGRLAVFAVGILQAA